MTDGPHAELIASEQRRLRGELLTDSRNQLNDPCQRVISLPVELVLHHARQKDGDELQLRILDERLTSSKVGRLGLGRSRGVEPGHSERVTGRKLERESGRIRKYRQGFHLQPMVYETIALSSYEVTLTPHYPVTHSFHFRCREENRGGLFLTVALPIELLPVVSGRVDSNHQPTVPCEVSLYSLSQHSVSIKSAEEKNEKGNVCVLLTP